ncbi:MULTISPECIES: DUF1796 family putative cysteine peptidase [Paenibacillus]|uniref:DUF1796 family putative cysteine peptidase n=1 Tax=Paenibacillus TaxID=44249 RepID=UPI0022B88C6E|nr:DUF1796 family putative cysteine peptidase [Paenibacillus caseinilyticus]MCZ8520822.1 DUF1796 family putative cysteine peptidase [Paenibacillus caseinilyticus]
MPWSTASRSYGAIISLGANCQTAYQLRRLKLRKASYPFDWFYFSNTAEVIRVLQTDFAHFMLRENLEPRQPSRVTTLVRDRFTTCWSYHDFPLPTKPDQDPLYGYPEFRQKLDRRIARFYETVRSGQRILFIRNHVKAEEAAPLKEALDALTAPRRCSLLLVNYHEESQGMKEEGWGLGGVHTVRIAKGTQWYGDSKEWDELLRNVRLIRG